MQKASALGANDTGIPVHIAPPPVPPIPSISDNQTMISAAMNVPEIKAWSDKWQYAGMDFNGTGNPVVWQHAIVLLYSPPDANTPLKCANGWTARVQVDLITKKALHAWYPDMQSPCTGYAELKKTDSSDGLGHVTTHNNAASLTPSTHIGDSEATEQDVTSGQWYGNEAFFPTPSYSSNIFKDMNALVGFTLNDNFNTANGFTQAGWIMTEIPGCGGCNLSAGTTALAYVDESISGAGDAAYNIGYTWVNGQNVIAEVICNTGTSKYDIDITYGSTYAHHTNISCSTYQTNDRDNNSIWFENQNTIQSSLWSGDITSSISASHAYKFDYQAINAYSWSSSNDYDRTAGVDQTSSVMTGNVASFGTATWSSLSNVPLFTDPNTIYVSSQDTSFNPHQGMGVALSPGGSSSTPALFEGLTSGQGYNVTPQDYGGYYFDYWRYSGDSVVPKSVTAGGTIQTLVPIYSTTAVQINAQDQNGNPLSLYTTLYNAAGNPIRTGFTPITFGLNYGQTYSVTVADYNPYYFNYWDDDHTNQVRQRSFAVYGGLQTYTVDFSTTSVHIASTDTSGNVITGLYAPLSENGQVVKQGWTPADYGLDSGATYTVNPNDYGSNYFNHWHDSYDAWDGSRTRSLTLTGPQNPTFTAIYYSSPAQGFMVTATDWNNNPLTGFYVPISPCGGDNQCSAFTPGWFTYLYGSSYTVTPNDYGNYVFDHWQDTGSTIRARSIAPSTSLPSYNSVFKSIISWQNPGYDYQVTTDTSDQSESAISSKADASSLVVGNNDLNGNNCDIFQSTNGGTGWNSKGVLTKVNPSDAFSDPSIALDYSGKFYYTCIEFNPSNSTGLYVVMQQSTDGGNTWPNSYTVVGHHSDSVDKPWLASDSNSGSSYKNNVYGCWTDFYSNGTSKIFFKRYVDYPSSTIPYDSDTNKIQLDSGAVQGCSIAIGPGGQVYVTWENGGIGSSGTIFLKRNLSGGDPTKWDGPYTVGTYDPVPPPECQRGGSYFECINGINGANSPFTVLHYPSIATDSSGAVHVTWMTYHTGTLTDIMYTNSNSCASGTCQFGTPIQINLDTGAADQWEPAITVSNSGNVVHVTAYDRRDDSNNEFYRPYDYYCSYGSLINCMSQSQWLNVQSSSAGSSNLDLTSDLDDYHSITTSNVKQAYTVWTDSRDISTNSNYNIYSELTTR
ncbi:hypothetical protein [Candidatus Nitrosotalea okcheonensis]|nr:hypothetical protein [Candidatus Nitrosotalea okcheonensis]